MHIFFVLFYLIIFYIPTFAVHEEYLVSNLEFPQKDLELLREFQAETLININGVINSFFNKSGIKINKKSKNVYLVDPLHYSIARLVNIPENNDDKINKIIVDTLNRFDFKHKDVSILSESSLYGEVSNLIFLSNYIAVLFFTNFDWEGTYEQFLKETFSDALGKELKKIGGSVSLYEKFQPHISLCNISNKLLNKFPGLKNDINSYVINHPIYPNSAFIISVIHRTRKSEKNKNKHDTLATFNFDFKSNKWEITYPIYTELSDFYKLYLRLNYLSSMVI